MYGVRRQSVSVASTFNPKWVRNEWVRMLASNDKTRKQCRTYEPVCWRTTIKLVIKGDEYHCGVTVSL